jgi:anti-anti-sigma factor
LGGELDAWAAPAFDLELRLLEATADAELVVIDLRGLTFMDSRGMSVLVAASLRLEETGRRLIAIRGPRAVDRVFMLTGRTRAIEMFDLEPPEPAVGVLLKMAANAATV